MSCGYTYTRTRFEKKKDISGILQIHAFGVPYLAVRKKPPIARFDNYYIKPASKQTDKRFVDSLTQLLPRDRHSCARLDNPREN